MESFTSPFLAPACQRRRLGPGELDHVELYGEMLLRGIIQQKDAYVQIL
jgi:hypothetical protein